jgi:predicted nuclease of predicted toxin-antitoxin system
MKFKLDENIGQRGIELLKTAGHDVMTVRDQGLQGADDEAVFHAIRSEDRALITLDHDFGHVLRFPPETSPGIVILELPARATLQALLDRLRDFLALLETRSLAKELWIVEPGRVRVHQRGAEDL